MAVRGHIPFNQSARKVRFVSQFDGFTSINYNLPKNNALNCTIYFDMGHKNPKIVLDNCDFIMHSREVKRTIWLCSRYFAGFTKTEGRCKAKLITREKIVYMSGTHNHEPKIKCLKFNNMLSQKVRIVRE
ncbi:hypothetical protein WA026_007541 [Henosepilachna vigintioctopunctata]|uniref:FLYWCH-type domain-containing protein n=1 Tax=Henosepilachna vigintioctopunctata TaxID=420089 RepID=A0AAW1UQ70_9CUCU